MSLISTTISVFSRVRATLCVLSCFVGLSMFQWVFYEFSRVFREFSQVFTSFHKFLQVFTSFHKISQVFTSFHKFSQVFTFSLTRARDLWRWPCFLFSLNSKSSLVKKQIRKFATFNFQTSSFLVACTRLYKSLCRSVRRSVGWSVGRSVTLLSFCNYMKF